MGKYTTYVGLDVHARSVKASAVDVETGESFSRAFAGSRAAADIIEWVAGLPQPAYCAYESGCCGFVLARLLRASRIDCDVIAVSTLPRSSKDRKQKCDKLDARAIRREIANPDHGYSVVWIPDEACEAERDLCRAYRCMVDETKRAKQRLLMFLMRHGHVWDERTPAGTLRKTSTRAFEAWLDSICFGEGAAEKAYASYRRQLKAAQDELGQLRGEVRSLAAKPENKPFVDAFRLLRGIGTENAMLAKAEIGSFSRFGSGRALSSWLGTVPEDGSSGDAERHGRITKSGNKYLRKALIEGWSGAASWKCGRKAVPPGSEAPAALQAVSRKANARLFERYTYLLRERRKANNKAKVAVVSELVRWIWVIGLMVEREQAACARQPGACSPADAPQGLPASGPLT